MHFYVFGHMNFMTKPFNNALDYSDNISFFQLTIYMQMKYMFPDNMN